MKNKVTFLIVVETNIDDYPEDQSTEIYKGEFYQTADCCRTGAELRANVLNAVSRYADTIYESWGCIKS